MGRWWVAGLVVVGCGGSDAVIRESEVFVEPDTGLYVADHDVPVETLAEALALEDPVVSTGEALTVAQVNGRDDLWPRTSRQSLTYCIDAVGFGAAASSVAAALTQASADWEKSANVHFVHAAGEDARCTRSNGEVMFDVRPVKGRAYLARSFFPSQGRAVRELLIDQTALPPPKPWSLTGVVRHELGHVLGLRHEHTRLRSNPCFEDSDWRAVTPYDRRSVMHYPQCAGVKSGDLLLTDLDRQGIATLYP